ncbi:MAG: methyltransferase domain-containing protein [Octadecabacter sp.]|nr:methyltransferase domain-containing protein [Octadecabacter sp.]
MPQPTDTDSTEVHLNMFAGHDNGRMRRIDNGRYMAEVLYPVFKPKTVIDLGCGLGFFLKAMANEGSKVTAVDNDWVKDLETEVPKDSYVFHDLNEPFKSPKRYALATSFEVAEHLKPERSESFVDDLCALSNTVAFSAAIPGQGGSGHINLRWQSDWVEMFAERGYRCYDAIRPEISNKEDSYFWFRQNAFLFVKDGSRVPASVAGREITADAANQVCRNLYNRQFNRMRARLQKLQARVNELEA